jgi:hypothetical protein
MMNQAMHPGPNAKNTMTPVMATIDTCKVCARIKCVRKKRNRALLLLQHKEFLCYTVPT